MLAFWLAVLVSFLAVLLSRPGLSCLLLLQRRMFGLVFGLVGPLVELYWKLH